MEGAVTSLQCSAPISIKLASYPLCISIGRNQFNVHATNKNIWASDLYKPDHLTLKRFIKACGKLMEHFYRNSNNLLTLKCKLTSEVRSTWKSIIKSFTKNIGDALQSESAPVYSGYDLWVMYIKHMIRLISMYLATVNSVLFAMFNLDNFCLKVKPPDFHIVVSKTPSNSQLV